MNDKPWNTINEGDIVAVLAQWAEWRDALKGVDPAKLMAALEAMREAKERYPGRLMEVYSAAEKVIALLPKPETP